MPDPPVDTSSDPTQPETSAPDPPDEQQPGIRASALIEVHKRALNQTLKGCTAEKVIQCFPSAKPAVLKDVHKQLVGQYEKLGTVGLSVIIHPVNSLLTPSGCAGQLSQRAFEIRYHQKT